MKKNYEKIWKKIYSKYNPNKLTKNKIYISQFKFFYFINLIQATM